jgi:hypothetical protein
MRRLAVLVSVVLCLPALAPGQTKETIIPAGSLLRCTLDEPNFSSASAEVGDPVICHARGVQDFGHAVFPRGAYLAGHLADSKDPGHFWGKGWLKLEFDRISLPDTELPVPAKIVAVRGYRVNREGKIIGHGHPRRDAIEWSIPLLWPWKLVSLPARGPRPTLKGETEVTLRLMDDVEVPLAAEASRPAAQAAALRPTAWGLPSEPSPRPANGSRPIIRYLPPNNPWTQGEASGATTTLSAAPATERVLATERPAAQLTLIALKGEAIYAATDYWIDWKEGGRLLYLLRSGAEGALDLDEVDWAWTMQLNAERGITVTLRDRPARSLEKPSAKRMD